MTSVRLLFHDRRLGQRILGEVGDIAGRPHDIFAGRAKAEIIVALEQLRLREPSFVVFNLAPRPLRHQGIADAQGQRFVGGKLGDGLVVLGIILTATAGVDQAGDAEPVELTHHVPG